MSLRVTMVGMAWVVGVAGLSLPAVAEAQGSTEEACMVVQPSTNVENVFIGPGAFLSCAQLLQSDPTSYPTQRPPDSVACGTRHGETMVIMGFAFAPSQSATVTCTPGALWKGVPA